MKVIAGFLIMLGLLPFPPRFHERRACSSYRCVSLPA